MKIAKLFLLAAFVPAVALGDYAADKKKYDECVAIQKRAYPVPPNIPYWVEGNIREACGPAPVAAKPEQTAAIAVAQTQAIPPAPIMPDAIKWTSPATLPGVQNAWVLGAGDRPGPYLLRGKLAQGARIPPHTHPEERSGTVLSGTVYVGFSPTFDESKAVAIPAGGVWVAPANVPHFLWAKDGEAVFQCGGIGPSATSFIKQ
jgi:hypothetical protein